MFKHVFADPDDTLALQGFLAAVLDLPAEDLAGIKIQDPHQIRHQPGGKEVVFDVKATTATGKSLEIEVQLVNVDGFPERLAYYVATILTHQLKRGEDYNELKQAISVAIADFNITGDYDRDYHHRFQLYDRLHGITLTEVLQVDLMEIPKLPAESDGTLLWDWLRFIGARSRKDLDQAMRADSVIKHAGDKVRAYMDQRSDYRAWVARRKMITEMDARALDRTLRRIAREEGLAEEKAEGLTQGKTVGSYAAAMELARSMLARGYSLEVVADLINLTEDDMSELIAKST